MSKVIVEMSLSLDGFIAGPDDTPDRPRARPASTGRVSGRHRRCGARPSEGGHGGERRIDAEDGGRISIAMTAAAIRVLAAATTATNPTAATSVDGAPNTGASAVRLAAPTKKIGVKMPPLPPASSVIDVARILRRKAPRATCDVPASTPLIVSVPRPAWP